MERVGSPVISRQKSLTPRVPTSDQGRNRFSWRHRWSKAGSSSDSLGNCSDDDPAYKFADSYVRSAITHIETRTSIRLISSNAKGAMGLVRCPYVLADEPGSWEVTGGTLMFDAIQTAMGKPGSPLKAIYTGTLAPSTGGWWHSLVAERIR